jgi:DNA polymerase III subunit epsilon
MSARYLVLDTETGGLDANQHSLLSIGLVVSEAHQIVDQLEILIRHEPYIVSGGGMKVNRIDLASHHETAQEPEQAIQTLETFCTRHFGDASITLIGHNIAFDRAFLGTFLERQGRNLEPRFHHRTIDTHAIAAALIQAGKLPKTLRPSSDGLFTHFGILVPPEKRHTALGDAIATHQLYWKLIEAAR